MEEYERHFSFLHLSVCSVWSVSLLGETDLSVGHIWDWTGLDWSKCVCVCVYVGGGVPTVE